MLYLGQPYSDPDPLVREARYLAGRKAAAALAKTGLVIYAPIVHWHPTAVAEDMPTDFEFWMNNDLHVLGRCDVLLVLCLDGWRESRGLDIEMRFAHQNNIPMNYLMLGGADAKDFLKQPTHPGNPAGPKSRRN